MVEAEELEAPKSLHQAIGEEGVKNQKLLIVSIIDLMFQEPPPPYLSWDEEAVRAHLRACGFDFERPIFCNKVDGLYSRWTQPVERKRRKRL